MFVQPRKNLRHYTYSTYLVTKISKKSVNPWLTRWHWNLSLPHIVFMHHSVSRERQGYAVLLVISISLRQRSSQNMQMVAIRTCKMVNDLNMERTPNVKSNSLPTSMFFTNSARKNRPTSLEKIVILNTGIQYRLAFF
jgi:hypothetical protein